MESMRCLNPCSNGICSLSLDYYAEQQRCRRLNPCSNGICSLRDIKKVIEAVKADKVLILVLMEYAH